MSRAIALAQSSCFSTLRQTFIRPGAVGLILRTRPQTLGQPRSPHAPHPHAQHAPRAGARAYSQLFLLPQTAPPRSARRRLLTTTPTFAAPPASTARPVGSENNPTYQSSASSSSDSGSTATTTTTTTTSTTSTSEGICKSSPSPGTTVADTAIRAAPKPKPYLTRAFWSCKHTWRRAMVNTFRCLVGCSIGDLGTMYYLMAYYPDIDMGTSMALSMTAGITTSILLETTLLHLGKDRLEWGAAAKTAMGMSLVSMLAMEFTENLVTLGLSDASTTITSPNFWAITGLSMAAGFLAPLPYNYVRLKLWGKACH